MDLKKNIFNKFKINAKQYVINFKTKNSILICPA